MVLAIGVPAYIGHGGMGSAGELDYVTIGVLLFCSTVLLFWMIDGLYRWFWWHSLVRVKRLSEGSKSYIVRQLRPLFSSRTCTYSQSGQGYYYEDGQYERIDEETRLLIVDMLEQEEDAKREAVEARKRVELAKQNKEKADAEAAKELANQSELQSLAKEEIKGKQAKRGGVTVADPDRRGSVSIVNRS